MMPTWRALMDIEPQRCHEHRLSHWDYIILSDVEEHPGTSQRDVARRIVRSASRIADEVESLQARGLVTRTPAAHDRRVNCLQLTKAGRNLTQRVRRAIRADERELLSELSPTEQNRLRALLTKAIPTQLL